MPGIEQAACRDPRSVAVKPDGRVRIGRIVLALRVVPRADGLRELRVADRGRHRPWMHALEGFVLERSGALDLQSVMAIKLAVARAEQGVVK